MTTFKIISKVYNKYFVKNTLETSMWKINYRDNLTFPQSPQSPFLVNQKLTSFDSEVWQRIINFTSTRQQAAQYFQFLQGHWDKTSNGISFDRKKGLIYCGDDNVRHAELFFFQLFWCVNKRLCKNYIKPIQKKVCFQDNKINDKDQTTF